MKAKWSDYRNSVYGYLKHYKHFNGQIANLELEAKGIKEELKSLYDVNLTVNYGEHTQGGYNELLPTERIVQRKQYLETKLSILNADYQRITNLLNRVDNALLYLGDVEQKILRLKYIKGKRWYDISGETGYSERRCQDIAKRSVNNMTEIMFPESATGQQRLNFVFIKPENRELF